ncbi:MAG: polysaccharide biosynthesis/export family protein [Bacteroidales bacterium]|nr:polysaccharide biosynthesis/export family protein [Bacteroidales bacterium]
MIIKSIKYLISLILTLAICSCSSNTYKNIYYVQGVLDNDVIDAQDHQGILIEPHDIISVIVSSRNAELANEFNLVNQSFMAGDESGRITESRVLGYFVDDKGDIDFPHIGKIHVAGLNRWQIENLIKTELKGRGLLTDANVTVELMNFKITVKGEVKTTGSYSITGDRINVFQAISMAQDLTVHGQRKEVKVIREADGMSKIYVLDLTSKDVFNSPAFYLQQEDIVYVTPNSVKAGSSTINENYLRSGSFWTLASSFALTLTHFIIKMSKKRQ